MKYEIEAAAEFITRLLFPNTSPSTSPRSNNSVSMPALSSVPSEGSAKFNPGNEREEGDPQLFYKKMCKELGKKFLGHWYEDEPIKGQAYRSLLVDSENNFIDKVILSSAQKANIKNVEARLKAQNVAFQMWIDPKEVEVEYLCHFKTRKSNELLYSSRNISTRPPSPPSPSSSPSISSPPSSPVPSSYILSTSPSSVHYHSAPSLPHSIPLNNRQNKPIRISHRQNDEPVFFDKTFFPHDKDVNSTSVDNLHSPVKTVLSIPQRAM